ncbi:MarR family transcriptional regulator [Candidatus Pacearchaeota archaeon]|nr:MarR family transcriptional regulator [Candidatus Pacearchaeota archaeon]
MKRIQELYGFIISSKRRENVLKSLKIKPLRPFELAKKTKYKAPNVSNALFQLQKYKLVECITPNKSSWRVYAITDLGKEVLKYKP